MPKGVVGKVIRHIPTSGKSGLVFFLLLGIAAIYMINTGKLQRIWADIFSNSTSVTAATSTSGSANSAKANVNKTKTTAATTNKKTTIK